MSNEAYTMCFYAFLQVFVNLLVYLAVRQFKVKSRFGLFLATLFIGFSAALTSLGPFGLIFGGPSIVIASISTAAVLPLKEDKCSNCTTKVA